MADGNITKDILYDAVAPDDFESMLELDRYGARSTAFDRIISATHDHFWDPLDPKYIDFSAPWDMENEALLPDDQVVSLGVPYVLEHLEKTGQKEARHVTAFAKYIKARWGRPRPCGVVLQQLLVDIIAAPEVYKKIIGMQMLVEGLAMGAFATGFQFNRDPLARKLFQLVMTDEAFHHKFGKIWADRTIPKMSQEERETVEDWAAHCFQSLLFNLGSPIQQAGVYRDFGLDPDKVLEGVREIIQNDDARRERLKSQTNIFRVLIKTLNNAGLITERTRAFYATYVDMEELRAEGDKMVGDDIAEEGIKYLQEINFKDRARTVSIAAE